MKAFTFNTCTV